MEYTLHSAAVFGKSNVYRSLSSGNFYTKMTWTQLSLNHIPCITLFAPQHSNWSKKKTKQSGEKSTNLTEWSRFFVVNYTWILSRTSFPSDDHFSTSPIVHRLRTTSKTVAELNSKWFKCAVFRMDCKRYHLALVLSRSFDRGLGRGNFLRKGLKLRKLPNVLTGHCSPNRRQSYRMMQSPR